MAAGRPRAREGSSLLPSTEAFDKRTAGRNVEQAYGHLAPVRIGLPAEVRHGSVAALNRMLANSLALRDLYKKSHWQTSGVTFYQLHLLFDKHYAAQDELVDALAERVQTLGGIALSLAEDVVHETRISRSPRGREAPIAELNRLLDAHEMILQEARVLAREAADRGDDGTNEMQSWFIGEHLSVTRPPGGTST